MQVERCDSRGTRFDVLEEPSGDGDRTESRVDRLVRSSVPPIVLSLPLNSWRNLIGLVRLDVLERRL